MSQVLTQPFKFFRNKKVASSNNAITAVRALADLAVRPATGTRSYYKHKVNFDNAFVMHVFEEARTSEMPLTVGEYIYNAFIKLGLDYSDERLRVAYTREIHAILADSAEGHLLVINKKVAVLAGVRAPVWFRRLPLSVQVTVPVRSSVDQGAELGYNPSNLPALTGQSYDAVRSGYMGLTSVGKKWRNPAKIAQIKAADAGLNTLAINDAVTREQKEAFSIALDKAREEKAQAETKIEALLAEMNERSIRSEANAFSANAAVQSLLSAKDAIILPEGVSDMLASFAAFQKSMTDRVETLAASVAASAPAPKAKRTRRAKQEG